MLITLPRRARLLAGTLCAAFAASTALADLRTWTGNGDGVSWEDAANWSGNALPGPRDDVQINVGSGVVLFSARATVASFSSTRAFGIEGGSLTVTGAFTINAASLTVNGGAITGAPVLTSSTISIADSLVSPVTVIATGTGNTLTKLGSTLGTVTVRAGGATGQGALAIPDEFVNGGVIRLESTSTGGQQCVLLNNESPLGTIVVRGGSAYGNARLIIDVLAAMAGTVQLDLASARSRMPVGSLRADHSGPRFLRPSHRRASSPSTSRVRRSGSSVASHRTAR